MKEERTIVSCEGKGLPGPDNHLVSPIPVDPCGFLAFDFAIYALVTVTLSASQQLVEGLYIAPEAKNAQGRFDDYQFSSSSILKEANTKIRLLYRKLVREPKSCAVL